MNISKDTFRFLSNLKENNNREWFTEHKPTYEKSRQDVIQLGDFLVSEMNKHDQIETLDGKKSVFRIYKDVRFSKDKSPYKSNFSGYLRRATALLRGGYYYHLEPGNSYVAGGFFSPSSDDLKHIRSHVDSDDSILREVLKSSEFISHFGELLGNKVKSAPRGYAKDHPSIDILRYKSFYVEKHFTDKEVHALDFGQQVIDTFVQFRPFFDAMSEILTTDLNGESIVDIS